VIGPRSRPLEDPMPRLSARNSLAASRDTRFATLARTP
jgi:hypothetical protein